MSMTKAERENQMKNSEGKARISEEAALKIRELQLLEQSLQNLVMQKQAFQLESNDVENASAELQKTKEEAYKIVGSIMIKADKKELEKDLAHKKEIIWLRIKNIEKQEQAIREKLSKIRDEVMRFLK